jgi:hypothetical protein
MSKFDKILPPRKKSTAFIIIIFSLCFFFWPKTGTDDSLILKFTKNQNWGVFNKNQIGTYLHTTVYNKLVQKAFSGHFAGSFFHSFIHSFSFEPSLMNKPSLPVQQACSPPSLPTKRRISSIACLPACLLQLCMSALLQAGNFDHTSAGTWQQTTVLVWFLFGSALHVWA